MKNDWTKTGVAFFLILLAAFSRLVPHPNNFTAIGALAIYAAAVVPNRFLAAILPLIAMWVSDLVLNNVLYASYSQGFVFFSQGVIWIYLGVLCHSLATWWLAKETNVVGISGASAMGAILFFVFSNVGVWWGAGMYPRTIDGLILCYTAALPFFGNFLAGNLFFCAVLFGLHYLLEKRTRIFRLAA